MAALGEFSGGVLTVLGFLNPLGPLNIAAAMTVAIRRAHWNKPVWASAGGAELPLTNLAAALTLALTGPGRLSLDGLFGFRLPRWLAGLMTVSAVAVTAAALQRPEIAETIAQKAGDILRPGSRQARPDLEVETRPRPAEAPSQPSPTA
jgi:putative oxidoreductase